MFTSAIPAPYVLTPSRGKGQGWKGCYWFKRLSKNSSASALVFQTTLLYLYMTKDYVDFSRAAEQQQKSEPNFTTYESNDVNQNQEMPLQNSVS